MPSVSVMVEGGKATASAPLGPALGPLGINIGEVVSEINQKTKEFAGMKVPVKVNVDSASKEFDIEIGFPPMSAIIKQEAGIKSASKDPKREFVADISIDQAIKIARQKADSLYSYKLKSSVKEVVGSCDSMGIKVEGKRASETIKDIEAGKFDSKLSGKGTETEKPATATEEAKETPAEEKKEGPKGGASEKKAKEEKAEEKEPAEEKAEEKLAGQKTGAEKPKE